VLTVSCSFAVAFRNSLSIHNICCLKFALLVTFVDVVCVFWLALLSQEYDFYILWPTVRINICCLKFALLVTYVDVVCAFWLALLSQEYDFHILWPTVRLLTLLLSNKTRDIQEIILASPMGVSKLMDLLVDSREVIRNDVSMNYKYIKYVL